MLKIKVENAQSNAGNDIPNQFRIWADDGVYFQSYKTIIAYKDLSGKITLDSDKWDYSRTTGKYRNKFLNEGIADTRKKIASGEYKLANLN